MLIRAIIFLPFLLVIFSFPCVYFDDDSSNFNESVYTYIYECMCACTYCLQEGNKSFSHICFRNILFMVSASCLSAHSTQSHVYNLSHCLLEPFLCSYILSYDCDHLIKYFLEGNWYFSIWKFNWFTMIIEQIFMNHFWLTPYKLEKTLPTMSP